jgi:hypothetical protein
LGFIQHPCHLPSFDLWQAYPGFLVSSRFQIVTILARDGTEFVGIGHAMRLSRWRERIKNYSCY